MKTKLILALLNGTDGRLLFRGGITGSRGQLGDNDAYDAWLSLISQDEARQINTAVFGCSLNDKRSGRTGTGASDARD